MMKSLLVALLCAAAPACADTVTLDFLDKVTGPEPSVGSQLTLTLGSDGSIAAALTPLTSTGFTQIVFDAPGAFADYQHIGKPAGSFDAGMTYKTDNFLTGWYVSATTVSASWTITRSGGFASVYDLFAGKGSANWDAAVLDKEGYLWFAAAPAMPAVPLPAAAPLLLAGLGALGLMRRR